MTDFHIHIGQYKEVYYSPLDILRIVTEASVSSVMFSSTTSCKDDVHYKEVEQEIAKVFTRYPSDSIKPYLWYIPSYIDEGISVENVFQDLPYSGIKLHPRVNHWCLWNRKHSDCLHKLFGYANDHNLPILIHTGVDSFERPAFFREFFATYPNAKIVLAHCRPVVDTLEVFHQYPNVSGDTAFLPDTDFGLICKAGYKGRLLPGSDFPITHYFREDTDLTLSEQYTKDVNSTVMICCQRALSETTFNHSKHT